MPMKRIFLIAGIVLAVLLIGFFAYYYFVYRPAVPENVVDIPLPPGQEVTLTPEEVQQGKTLEEKHEELRRELGITAQDDVVTVAKVLDRPVLAPTLSADGLALYFFDPKSGQFRTTDTVGANESSLVGGTFENVSRIKWAPTKDAVAISFTEGSVTKNVILTLEDQTLVELDPRIQYPVFSPDGLRIVYLFSDPESGQFKLSTALRDGTNAQALKSYRAGELQLHWFAEEGIAYGGVSSGFKAASVFSMDTRGERNRTLLGDAYAADMVFSPIGNRVVFSEAPRKPYITSLLLMDATGQNVVQTSLDTLARKCAWSSTGFTLLCGVPAFPDEQYTVPEDYEDEKWVTRDDLYRVNATTGEATQIVKHSQYTEGYDISDPFLSPEQDTLYFTRRNDGRLYAYYLP